ncbi:MULTISPECIES: hypothetical protein [unclassified Kaistella]|uniref:hypothetical protein n=1 Tax=unclassified Kaistella TaxID=2762626 RepID=UPI0027376DE9|nr:MULTISPECIES: hypothetical protein [unclassified Kaistella]MDP2455139.1 hypothetical protein [Kaistella sp. SH11-4b]MDP2458046.1 hypothetical protein [Kaistella sp. SH40-3]MDP2461013.1 hypothetical protein [Kaistella sp. SH19-2b]
MKKKYILYLSCLFTLILSSCQNKTGKLVAKSSSDGIINCKEFEEIRSSVPSNKREFANLFDSTGKIDDAKLKDFINNNSNVRSGPLKFDDCIEEITDVGLYLENSVSMLGYISNASDFQKNTLDIYSALGHNNKVSTYLVNQKLESKGNLTISGLADIITMRNKFLTPGSNVSDLNKVLENVLQNTKNSSISIIASDFIYSLGSQNLVVVGGKTKDVFLKNSKKISDLSVLFIQLDSQFNGVYYDMNDKPAQLNNVRRPYYFMVLGKAENIEKFSKIIKVNNLSGFLNSYYLTSKKVEPFQKILLGTEAVGRIKVDKTDPNKMEITKLVNNETQFSIAVDLSKYPDQSKLLDISNYKISQGYKIDKIEKINPANNPSKINAADWVTLKASPATHYIVIKNVGFPLKNDLILSLENKEPDWINRSSIDNDTNINQNLDKTFGINYLVNGIRDAFEQINDGDNSFFTLKYKIN